MNNHQFSQGYSVLDYAWEVHCCCSSGVLLFIIPILYTNHEKHDIWYINNVVWNYLLLTPINHQQPSSTTINLNHSHGLSITINHQVFSIIGSAPRPTTNHHDSPCEPRQICWWRFGISGTGTHHVRDAWTGPRCAAGLSIDLAKRLACFRTC